MRAGSRAISTGVERSGQSEGSIKVENVLLNNHCRYQTVGLENPKLYALLRGFYQKTGLPVLINTSLNSSGEPMIESPGQLLDHFDEMGLDAAVLEDVLIVKAESGIEPTTVSSAQSA